jgi:hypothetical protein
LKLIIFSANSCLFVFENSFFVFLYSLFIFTGEAWLLIDSLFSESFVFFLHVISNRHLGLGFLFLVNIGEGYQRILALIPVKQQQQNRNKNHLICNLLENIVDNPPNICRISNSFIRQILIPHESKVILQSQTYKVSDD